MNLYHYRDAKGLVFSSASPSPPPGCVHHVGPRTAGDRVVHVPFAAMDAMRRDVVLQQPAQTFDAAGRTRLHDGSFIHDTLAGAPPLALGQHFKIQQALLDAEQATGSHLDNVLASIRHFGQQYAAAASRATNEAAKDAGMKAANALAAFADAREATRNVA